jgi:hypothetical protein
MPNLAIERPSLILTPFKLPHNFPGVAFDFQKNSQVASIHSTRLSQVAREYGFRPCLAAGLDLPELCPTNMIPVSCQTIFIGNVKFFSKIFEGNQARVDNDHPLPCLSRLTHPVEFLRIILK